MPSVHPLMMNTLFGVSQSIFLFPRALAILHECFFAQPMPEADFVPIKMIVGLGNPGREYERTRHNVGFMVLDALAAQWGFDFSKQAKWKALVSSHGGRHFIKPQTYMNLSGQAVQSAGSFFKVRPAEMLVVVDDVSLPLGKLRLRPGGSAGGQNGMKSLIQCLGTDQFPRLKIGIGGADLQSLSGHVLGNFSPEERVVIDPALAAARHMVQVALEQGLAAAMRLNGSVI
jgi:peptidyl-tRNA hydrolase, PTH1 family